MIYQYHPIDIVFKYEENIFPFHPQFKSPFFFPNTLLGRQRQEDFSVFQASLDNINFSRLARDMQ